LSSTTKVEQKKGGLAVATTQSDYPLPFAPAGVGEVLAQSPLE